MFNFARISPNPAGNRAVSFFQEPARDRFLQADELSRFFKALASEPNDTLRDFFYVCLLTGARRSNVQSMRWDEIDLKGSTWSIPGAKTKNGEHLRVHLAEPAKVILKRRQEEAAQKLADGDVRYGEWVFPTASSTKQTWQGDVEGCRGGHCVQPGRNVSQS
jgi:integrase